MPGHTNTTLQSPSPTSLNDEHLFLHVSPLRPLGSLCCRTLTPSSGFYARQPLRHYSVCPKPVITVVLQPTVDAFVPQPFLSLYLSRLACIYPFNIGHQPRPLKQKSKSDGCYWRQTCNLPSTITLFLQPAVATSSFFSFFSSFVFKHGLHLTIVFASVICVIIWMHGMHRHSSILQSRALRPTYKNDHRGWNSRCNRKKEARYRGSCKKNKEQLVMICHVMSRNTDKKIPTCSLLPSLQVTTKLIFMGNFP